MAEAAVKVPPVIPEPIKPPDPLNIPDDVSWLRASFLIDPNHLDEQIKRARVACSADNKFQNTSLGGNYAVNMPPQFTHTADPLIKGVGSKASFYKGGMGLSRLADENGMGRYYSEAIDDNKEMIHMRFGVTEFNSLAYFFSGAYDSDQGKLARSGEASGSLINRISTIIGELAGFVAAIPLVAIHTAFRLGAFAVKSIFGVGFLPSSRYYYIKPTMRLYWKAVNYMTNALAVNMAILPSYRWDGTTNVEDKEHYSFLNKDNKENKLSADDISQMHKAMPDIFREEGGIDVRAVSSKAKRLELLRRQRLIDIMEAYEDHGDRSTAISAMNALMVSVVTADFLPDPVKGFLNPANPFKWYLQYLESNLAKVTNAPEQEVKAAPTEGAAPSPEAQQSIFQNAAAKATATVGSWLKDSKESENFSDDTLNYLKAEMLSGADWVTFRVTGEKTVTESFSNETGQSALAEKINSTSGSMRDTKFNLAGGNIGIPVLQELLDFVGGVSSGAISTFASYSGLDGLGALLGGGYIEIPHSWKNSSATLPKIEYNIELRATYGNKISIFTDIYVPLLMLLGGGLPLSTGRNSYTSPFLVEIYRKGRSQVRLGIVDSISITRGTGNTGWSVDQLPLGVDVSFSVLDLTQIMHLPIDDSLGAYDDDSTYTDYMATLGSLGLTDMTMWPEIVARAKAKFQYDWHNLIFESPRNMASLFANINVPIPGMNVAIKDLVTLFSQAGGGDPIKEREGSGNSL